MEPMLDEFRAVAEELTFHAPRIPIVSNVTGAARRSEEIRPPSTGCGTCARPSGSPTASRRCSGRGRHPLPRTRARRRADRHGAGRAGGRRRRSLVPALRADRDEAETRADGARRGCTCTARQVDWAACFAGPGGRRVDLPTYAFQRERYWLDDRRAAAGLRAAGRADAAFWAAVEREDLAAARRRAATWSRGGRWARRCPRCRRGGAGAGAVRRGRLALPGRLAAAGRSAARTLSGALAGGDPAGCGRTA